jgi:hypothetical protein
MYKRTANPDAAGADDADSEPRRHDSGSGRPGEHFAGTGLGPRHTS